MFKGFMEIVFFSVLASSMLLYGFCKEYDIENPKMEYASTIINVDESITITMAK